MKLPLPIIILTSALGGLLLDRGIIHVFPKPPVIIRETAAPAPDPSASAKPAIPPTPSLEDLQKLELLRAEYTKRQAEYAEKMANAIQLQIDMDKLSPEDQAKARQTIAMDEEYNAPLLKRINTLMMQIQSITGQVEP